MLKRKSQTKLEWDGEYDEIPEDKGDLQKGYKSESAGRPHRVNSHRYYWEEDNTVYPGDEQ